MYNFKHIEVYIEQSVLQSRDISNNEQYSIMKNHNDNVWSIVCI